MKHAGTSANKFLEPGIAGRWRFFTGKEPLIAHYSIISDYSLPSTAGNWMQETCNSNLNWPLWIAEGKKAKTPQSKLEYRTALNQCLTVNKQKPAEKPFSLSLNVLIVQQSFQKMQAAYEIIWQHRANTAWSSHGWRYQRIRNGFTPTQPTKQFKLAGMY